jgi:archaellum component FlaC
MDTNELATKQDVEEIVGRVVSEVVGDALQVISERFDLVDQRFVKVDKRFEQIDRRFERMDKRFDRLEDKMGSVAATADHHSIDIRELQRKTA